MNRITCGIVLCFCLSASADPIAQSDEMSELQALAPAQVEAYRNCILTNYGQTIAGESETHNAALTEAVDSCQPERQALLDAYSVEDQPTVESAIQQTLAQYLQ